MTVLYIFIFYFSIFNTTGMSHMNIHVLIYHAIYSRDLSTYSHFCYNAMVAFS